MVNFPAPVGGTVLPPDFAPSVLFAVLYGLLLPLLAYRMLDRRSRCTLLIGTMAFSVERIVIFSLRAVQAHDEKRRFSSGLITYLQVSFGLGFIGIASDMVNIIRCLLVNPTFGPERYPESAAAASKGGEMTAPPEGTPDLTNQRSWVRGLTSIGWIPYLGATIPGIIAASKYGSVFDHQDSANMTATVRIVSTALVLPLNFLALAAVGWGRANLPRMSRKGATIIVLVLVYTSIIAIYRLSVMPTRTTSLREPTALNTPGGKAAFYICHVLPEWLATLTLFGFNVRKTIGTGFAGDWRQKDETEKEKEKRLKKEAEKLEKKLAKQNGTELIGKEV